MATEEQKENTTEQKQEPEQRQSYKLNRGEKFISISLLNNIISSSDIKKAVVEESNSELWYETLNGYGNVLFKNNVQYIGNVKYGILHNESKETPCKLTFPNGTIYEGTMINNEITGEGHYLFADGSEYTGGVLNGLRHGNGIFKSQDGITYEGEWKKGLKDGKGKIEQGNMILEGNWKEGSLKGKSRIKWKSGNLFDGELNDNKMQGNGYMIWYTKNEKYSGQWVNNLQNGFGIHIWYGPKGEQKFLRDRYVGQWLNGKRNGYGKFFYSNGSIYEGFWKDNKKEGFGIYIYPDRTAYIGSFKEDRKVDNNTVTELKKIYDEEYKKKTQRTLSKRTVTKKTNRTLNFNKSIIEKKETNKLESIKENVNEENKNPTNNENNNNNNQPAPNQGANDENTSVLNPEEQKENQKQKLLKEKRDKICKGLDEIKIPIDIHDLIELEPEIQNELKEIDNILLRNLSLITHLYMYACGRENIKDAELGLSTVTPSLIDTKNVFNNNLNKKKDEKESKNEVEEEKKENKEDVIDYDNIYNNDLYFCLDLQNFWKLIREVGLIDNNFSLADIDRIYYQNEKNYIDMFYIPDELNNGVKEEEELIYDYLYQDINKNKINFENKYKTEIDKSNVICNSIQNLNENLAKLNSQQNNNQTNSQNNNINNNNETNTNNKEDDELSEAESEKNKKIEYNPIHKFNLNKDIHENKNIILLRFFYELLIRIAYLKYQNEEGTLSTKLKNLFVILKTFFKAKRKNPDMSFITINNIDPKLKNIDLFLEEFIQNYYIQLNELFEDIYFCSIFGIQNPDENDKTITYKYFYHNIIEKIEKLKDLFEDKMKFVELLTIYYKEKKFLNVDEIDFNQIEIVNELEDIFNYQMIKYEFFEILFYICRKYINLYHIKAETDEEHEIYLEVINLIKAQVEKNKEELKLDNRFKFTYPKLKNHIQIEKLRKEAHERELEKQRQEQEKIRYENERKIMENEDENAYREEDDKANKSNSDSYDDY